MTSDRAGPDCSSTQVGYEAALLLPYNINGDENGELPPYSLTRAYPAVVSGDSKSMVIVPIATAFEILGLLLNIIAAGCGNPLFGWVSNLEATSAFRRWLRAYDIGGHILDRTRHDPILGQLWGHLQVYR